VTRIDDPDVVARQYADDANLRARQAIWRDVEGVDPKHVLWQALEAWQPRRLLEVGGGQGELAERIERELGARVSFVDVSPGMVELARARGVDAQVGDVQELPFADGSFDTVVAAWMLYHVADLDRALAEIARVLTPGGALLAVTTSVDHIAELRSLVGYAPLRSDMFTRESGEEHLRRHFREVARTDADVKATVLEREPLVAYRNSLAADANDVPDDVELPFVVHGRVSIFFATT
jgi:SAM-dependent methyltransferase